MRGRGGDRRYPGAARRVLLTVGTLVAAVLGVLMVGHGLPSPAGAQEIGPGSGGIRLVNQPAAITDGSFPLTLQLPGIIADDDVLFVSVHERIEDMDDFLASIVAEDLGGILGAVGSELEDLTIDSSGRVTVPIPVRHDPEGDIDEVLLARPGVYPVRVDLRDANQQLVGRIVTHLVRTPVQGEPNVGPLPVAVVADLHAGPEAGTIDQPAPADVIRIRDWMRVLDEHDLPATLSVSPWLLEAPGQQALVADLRDLARDRELVGTPLVRADEASLSRAGRAPDISELHGLGRRALSTYLGVQPRIDLWLSDGSTSDARVDLLTGMGVTSAILAADEVTGLTSQGSGASGTVRIDTGTSTVDAAVALDLAGMRDAEDPNLAAHQLLAELAVRSFDQDIGATMLFRSSDDLDLAAVDTLLSGLGGSPLLRATTAGELLDRRPEVLDEVEVELRSAPVEPLAGDPDLVDRANRTLSGYRSMIFDADINRLYQPLHVDMLLALADEVDTATREATWRTTTSRVLSEVAAVSPPPIDSVQLTSRDGRLPFSFQNGLDYPVRIEASFVSDQLTFTELEDGETSTLVLEPGVTSEEFTVRALTSGSFPLSIEMRSPDDALQLGDGVVSVRSTALSGVAVVLSVGAAAFLVLWWLTQLRRRHRRRDAPEPMWVRQELPA